MKNVTRYFFPGLLTAAILVCGFFWLREEVTSQIYRQKLQSLASEYSALADRYNHAVRQSAITELEVTETSVSVLIRTIDGTIRRIDTPFNPKKEIFIDYIVGNGRIWIRRLFDQSTPPESGLVIDPVWQKVDWQDNGLKYGKVIYRSLSPGVWSIQVSGNGSLNLEPSATSHPDALVASPEIRSFEEIQLSIDQEVQSINWSDIWNYCTTPFRD